MVERIVAAGTASGVTAGRFAVVQAVEEVVLEVEVVVVEVVVVVVEDHCDDSSGEAGDALD